MKIDIADVSRHHTDKNIVYHKEHISKLSPVWRDVECITGERDRNDDITSDNYVKTGKIWVSANIFKGPLPQKTKTNSEEQPQSPSTRETMAQSPTSNTKCDAPPPASNPIIPHFVYSQ